MLFNLDFADNTIVSCFFFFWIVDLYFLIPAGITQIFYPTTELAVPTGIPTKDVKTELETHPVTVETEVSIQYK